MFLIGQVERTLAIGPPEIVHCPKCEHDREFIPQLKYSYGRFDLLFGFVYNRRYQLACASCNHGWLLDARTAKQAYGKPAIPFLLQYGFLVLVGLVGLFGLAAYIYRRVA